MKSFLRPLLTLVAFASLAAAPAFADNLLVNGSFETGDFTGWTLSGDTSFTGVTTNFDGVNPVDGSFQAFFGSVSSNGYLSQTFSDVAGETYDLSYYLANFGGTPSFFSSAVDATTFDSETDPGGFGYTLTTDTFIGTGSDTVTFAFFQSPSYFLLDDVGVSSTVAATPEPSSLLLLGTGILSAAGAARRKFRKA